MAGRCSLQGPAYRPDPALPCPTRDSNWTLRTVWLIAPSSTWYDHLADFGARQEAQKGEGHMKQSLMLTITSLLSILFMTLHLADDIVFKMAPPGLANLFAVMF